MEERALGLAVLARAVVDLGDKVALDFWPSLHRLIHGDVNFRKCKNRHCRHARQLIAESGPALTWLTENSVGLRFWCDVAGVSMTRVQRRAKELTLPLAA